MLTDIAGFMDAYGLKPADTVMVQYLIVSYLQRTLQQRINLFAKGIVDDGCGAEIDGNQAGGK